MSIGDSKKTPTVDPVGEGSDEPSSGKTPAEGKKQTGRVQFDDRGNAIWEWSITTGAFGQDVTTERLQRLENKGLALADDAPTPFTDRVKPNPHGTVKGYNPYDSGKLAKTGTPKKTDLKKLSDWLKLKKQAANNKPDEEE